MRLMQGEGTHAAALVCLHCGAEQESVAPYPVVYCHCRSAARAARTAGDAAIMAYGTALAA
jgi:hypothetical protein